MESFVWFWCMIAKNYVNVYFEFINKYQSKTGL